MSVTDSGDVAAFHGQPAQSEHYSALKARLNEVKLDVERLSTRIKNNGSTETLELENLRSQLQSSYDGGTSICLKPHHKHYQVLGDAKNRKKWEVPRLQRSLNTPQLASSTSNYSLDPINESKRQAAQSKMLLLRNSRSARSLSSHSSTPQSLSGSARSFNRHSYLSERTQEVLERIIAKRNNRQYSRPPPDDTIDATNRHLMQPLHLTISSGDNNCLLYTSPSPRD